MNHINWNVVIVNILISTITTQIVVNINIKFLYKQLIKFRHDIVESCTDEVAEFVKKNLK